MTACLRLLSLAVLTAGLTWSEIAADAQASGDRSGAAPSAEPAPPESADELATPIAAPGVPPADSGWRYAAVRRFG